MRPCRIILADDHTLVRQGIKKILDENPGLEVIEEVADGQEAVNLLKKSQPDLVILDIQMPSMNGLEAAKMIRERCPAIKILILTMHKEDEYLRQAREIGVEGFVLKQDVDLILLSAIEAICSGKTFFSPQIDN
jgi:DNA-binding NarL/FixJ family response regulator